MTPTVFSLIFRQRKFPWITFGVLFCCIGVTVLNLLCPELYHSLAWNNQGNWLSGFFTGGFLHGDRSGVAMAVMHLLANILLFTPYSLMFENLLGRGRFGLIFLLAWVGSFAAFHLIVLVLVPSGGLAEGNGLSGIAFSLNAMGAFLLFQLFLRNKGRFFRQPLVYVLLSGLLGELFILMPNVYSMLVHLSGILIGIGLSVLFRKSICGAIK